MNFLLAMSAILVAYCWVVLACAAIEGVVVAMARFIGRKRWKSRS